MIVSIHQPAYLPWLGYFHKLILSDVFVLFDNAQFEKNSFINRNKIKTPQGLSWVSVPVKTKNHFEKNIREMELIENNWQKKHWKALELNYKKSAYWNHYAPKLKSLYNNEYKNIAEVCEKQLEIFLDFLEIETKIIKASELKKNSLKKDDFLLYICNLLNADVYISGALGKDYINEQKFKKNNIKLHFQDYKHPVYKQLWGEFIPYASVVDLIFNEGPKSRKIIMSKNLIKDNLYE